MLCLSLELHNLVIRTHTYICIYMYLYVYNAHKKEHETYTYTHLIDYVRIHGYIFCNQRHGGRTEKRFILSSQISSKVQYLIA